MKVSDKRFIVLGLGSFGQALAIRLAKNGCKVTGVDSDPKHIEAVQDQLYESIVADVTDRATLEQLLIPEADAVIISLGESIEASIMASLHVLELKARLVYAKGVSEEHGRILRKLGVSRVIFPEKEIAEQTADQITWPNVLEVLQLDPQYCMSELAVPTSLMGKTLAEASLPRRFGLFVVGLKDALHAQWSLMPGPEHKLNDEQLMLVIGKKSDLARFRELK